MGQQSAFHRKIKCRSIYREVPVDACWTDAFLYSEFFEAVERKSVYVCNPGNSTKGCQDSLEQSIALLRGWIFDLPNVRIQQFVNGQSF